MTTFSTTRRHVLAKRPEQFRVESRTAGQNHYMPRCRCRRRYCGSLDSSPAPTKTTLTHPSRRCAKSSYAGAHALRGNRWVMTWEASCSFPASNKGSTCRITARAGHLPLLSVHHQLTRSVREHDGDDGFIITDRCSTIVITQAATSDDDPPETGR